MQYDKKKAKKKPVQGVGFYSCPFCGYKDSAPLTGHNCWQGSPGALAAGERLERKISLEEYT